MTSFHEEPSANAPCTSTIVGLGAAADWAGWPEDAAGVSVTTRAMAATTRAVSRVKRPSEDGGEEAAEGVGGPGCQCQLCVMPPYAHRVDRRSSRPIEDQVVAALAHIGRDHAPAHEQREHPA